MCTATDVAGNQESQSPSTEAKTVTKMGMNAEPSVSVSSNTPVADGSPLNVVVVISDSDTADTHALTIDWGDGDSTAITVDQSSETSVLSRQHTYTETGTHEIGVTVTDGEGGRATARATALVKANRAEEREGPIERYDRNDDGVISIGELSVAVTDYLAGEISATTLLEVAYATV